MIRPLAILLAGALTAFAADESAVPSGMVALFSSTACPPGWTAHTQAQGRMLIAVTDPKQVGVRHGEALSRRDIPLHRHPYAGEMRYESAPHVDRLGQEYRTVEPGTVIRISGDSDPSSLQAPFIQTPVCRQAPKD